MRDKNRSGKQKIKKKERKTEQEGNLALFWKISNVF